MPKRAAFITIGQTPRIDLTPEMRKTIGSGLHIVEFGALDGLDAEEIRALRPAGGEHRFLTRLRDGGEVTLGKRWLKHRLQALLDDINRADFHMAVLLCTGQFGRMRCECLFLEAQRIVDRCVEAVAHGATTLGVMVPLAAQMKQVRYRRGANQTMLTAHASPYTPDRLERAAKELRKADIIVMDCMGYTEAMRKIVADVSGRPTLSARRLVATAVAQLL